MTRVAPVLSRRQVEPPPLVASKLGASFLRSLGEGAPGRALIGVSLPVVSGYLASGGVDRWAATQVLSTTSLSGVLAAVLSATPVNVTAELRATVSGERRAAPAPSARHRAREWAWRTANVERLRREFLGEWVVLEGEEIVGHGEDPVELVKAARRRGIRSPYLFRVEDKAEPRTSFLGV